MDKITRKQAFALGHTEYYTGKPCGRGHIAPRRVSDWRCRECAREDAKTYGKKPSVITMKVKIPREHKELLRAFVRDLKKL